MRQERPVFGKRWDPGLIARIYGLSAADVSGQPRTVSIGGTAFCVTVLASRHALGRARLNDRGAQALAALERDFMEPFLVTQQGATAAGDTYSRLLLPPPMPPEDPFTGSATGCMAAYLWSEGLIDRSELVAEQGHDMGRPGQARVRVLGPRDAIEGIEVAGKGVVVMAGTLRL